MLENTISRHIWTFDCFSFFLSTKQQHRQPEGRPVIHTVHLWSTSSSITVATHTHTQKHACARRMAGSLFQKPLLSSLTGKSSVCNRVEGVAPPPPFFLTLTLSHTSSSNVWVLQECLRCLNVRSVNKLALLTLLPFFNFICYT